MTALPFTHTSPTLTLCQYCLSFLASLSSIPLPAFLISSFILYLGSLAMPEDMNLSINGQSQVPPGFRFHPTEEELLHYYLRKKVAYEKIDLDVIREVDLNKLEPWDIQGTPLISLLHIPYHFYLNICEVDDQSN